MENDEQKVIDEKRKMLTRKSHIILMPTKSSQNYFLHNWPIVISNLDGKDNCLYAMLGNHCIIKIDSLKFRKITYDTIMRHFNEHNHPVSVYFSIDGKNGGQMYQDQEIINFDAMEKIVNELLELCNQ